MMRYIQRSISENEKNVATEKKNRQRSKVMLFNPQDEKGKIPGSRLNRGESLAVESALPSRTLAIDLVKAVFIIPARRAADAAFARINGHSTLVALLCAALLHHGIHFRLWLIRRWWRSSCASALKPARDVDVEAGGILVPPLAQELIPERRPGPDKQMPSALDVFRDGEVEPVCLVVGKVVLLRDGDCVGGEVCLADDPVRGELVGHDAVLFEAAVVDTDETRVAVERAAPVPGGVPVAPVPHAESFAGCGGGHGSFVCVVGFTLGGVAGMPSTVLVGGGCSGEIPEVKGGFLDPVFVEGLVTGEALAFGFATKAVSHWTDEGDGQANLQPTILLVVVELLVVARILHTLQPRVTERRRDEKSSGEQNSGEHRLHLDVVYRRKVFVDVIDSSLYAMCRKRRPTRGSSEARRC